MSFDIESVFGLNLAQWLELEFAGNTMRNILLALVVFLGTFVILKIFRKVILKKLGELVQKTETDLDDEFLDLVSHISSLFYWFLAFYLSSKVIQTAEWLETFLDGAFVILVVFEVIKVAENLVDFGMRRMASKRDQTAVAGIKLIAKIILWSTGLLLVLSNLGVNISSLVAGLGIGGIAVALAAQNILGDLFASFTIYFDKPFQIGDLIVLGNDKGRVKKIGLKTTRIQTLHGEELIISNKELTETRIQNFKKLTRRRVVFSIGVTYNTKTEKLKKIPKIIGEIIQSLEFEFERTHFREFGDFSLNFEVVYYVNSQSYDEYMDSRQLINFAIKERFDKEKIEIAFPTQTIYVAKE